MTTTRVHYIAREGRPTLTVDIRPMTDGTWETISSDGWRVATVASGVSREDAVTAANSEADALVRDPSWSVLFENDTDDDEDD